MFAMFVAAQPQAHAHFRRRRLLDFEQVELKHTKITMGRESTFFIGREELFLKNGFPNHPGGECFGPFVLLTAGKFVTRYFLLL